MSDPSQEALDLAEAVLGAWTDETIALIDAALAKAKAEGRVEGMLSEARRLGLQIHAYGSGLLAGVDEHLPAKMDAVAKSARRAIDPRSAEAAEFAASVLEAAAHVVESNEAADAIAILADQWRKDAARAAEVRGGGQ